MNAPAVNMTVIDPHCIVSLGDIQHGLGYIHSDHACALIPKPPGDLARTASIIENGFSFERLQNLQRPRISDQPIARGFFTVRIILRRNFVIVHNASPFLDTHLSTTATSFVAPVKSSAYTDKNS